MSKHKATRKQMRKALKKAHTALAVIQLCPHETPGRGGYEADVELRQQALKAVRGALGGFYAKD